MNHTYTYGTIDGINLIAEFKPSSHPSPKETLIYLHGGGLILGHRDDLPEQYINQLNDAGYHLLLLDYPLAPEADLITIQSCLKQALDWFHTNYQTVLNTTSPNHYLFGRSAGAYLALLLSHKYPSKYQKGIISFYGYYSLLLEKFQIPSKHYQQFPRSRYMDLYDLTEGGIRTQASVKERYILYVNYRQTGEWLSKILPNKALWESVSLDNTALSKLPKTFITASDSDKDVPYECSVHLSQIIPNNIFYPVHNQYHDFDRDPNNPVAIDIYNKLVVWLDKNSEQSL